jgi:hypothetical protein
VTATGWHVEGVIRCPGCGLYLDVDSPLSDLEQFTAAHDCAKEDRKPS